MFGRKDNRGHNARKGVQGFQPVKIVPLEAPTSGVNVAEIAGASSNVADVDVFKDVAAKFKKRSAGKVVKTLGAAAGAAGLALLLSACSASTMNKGTVSELDHVKPYTSYSLICSGVKIKTCVNTPIHHAEKWEVTFEGYNQDGNLETRTVEVDEGEYGSLKVGQDYALSGEQVKSEQDSAALGNNLLIGGGVVSGLALAGGGIYGIKRKIDERNYYRRLAGYTD